MSDWTTKKMFRLPRPMTITSVDPISGTLLEVKAEECYVKFQILVITGRN